MATLSPLDPVTRKALASSVSTDCPQRSGSFWSETTWPGSGRVLALGREARTANCTDYLAPGSRWLWTGHSGVSLSGAHTSSLQLT